MVQGGRETHSRRSLTFATDVLRAVAGLASAMGKIHNCSYPSGLWKEDLQVGLAWYVEGGRRRSGSKHDVTDCQGALDIPSWSWAFRWGETIKFRE
jgi:hypothetical protein